MFFDWLKRRRRDKILEQPWDPTWTGVLEQNIAAWASLNADEQAHLQQLVQVLVAEKHWEGAGGLELTDEHTVTVAGQACLLVLAIPHDLYRRVESIVIYPAAMTAPARRPGMFEVSGEVADRGVPLLGQAFVRGPVLFSWEAVRKGGRNAEDGHNVVFHEFAHKLDMLSGHADGVPPLEDKELYARWVDVFQREWEALHADQERGQRTFLDGYAGTNPAEFFAVATEHFFEQGRAMERKHPELYEVLHAFYRQNTAARG